MTKLICPVCKSNLKYEHRRYICGAGHSFDAAKSGYVNLILGGGGHGDSRAMIRSRRDFLSKGYYKQLSCAVADAAAEVTPDGGTIIDAGVGEGYYTEQIINGISARGKSADAVGIDISKDACDYAARRLCDAEICVASVYEMPLNSGCADTVVSVFSPAAYDEFLRVLRPGGALIMAIGGENHLWSLKKAVYDTPYKNEVKDFFVEGFSLERDTALDYTITLDSQQDIKSLFDMTPYSHKTSRQDMEKLNQLTSLTTEVSFHVLTYKKI